MPHSDQDRELLFAIFALRTDLIRREKLLDAVSEWLKGRALPDPPLLTEVLVRRGDLSESDRQLLGPLVERYLELHGRDPLQSLAALSGIESLVDELMAVADDRLAATLSYLGQRRVASDSGTSEQRHATPEAVRPGSDQETRRDLGRFRILRPHARGGLGEVLVARDTELNREVALKQIQARFADDPLSRSRFLIEAEITGGLEHPGIVPVYGLGHYADGRPFYAMRFVRGDSLKEAADAFHRRHASNVALNPAPEEPHKIPPADDPNADVHPTAAASVRSSRPVAHSEFLTVEFRKLLGRFVDVCQAIEYAHSRGVLHRDLKPGNIMLGTYGETLVVDWGLAKPRSGDPASGQNKAGSEPPLRPKSDSGSEPTELGSVIGTPAYMPPEQAAGRVDELGPASDVYSLGATLYYLLTGRPPFAKLPYEELLQAVQHGRFPRPLEVQPAIPRPLAAICVKALQLRPSDRYESAQALADEIERFLADEPVRAWSEPAWTRVRRWIRKHQALASSSVAVVIASTIGLTGFLIVLAGKNLELQVANQRIQQEEHKVRDERDVAAAISEFLRNDLLRLASPDLEPDRNITLRAVLDRAALRIGDQFAHQPRVEAALADTIGTTYYDLGELHRAEPHLVRGYELRLSLLGEHDPDTLQSAHHLAGLYTDLGRYDEAEALHDKVLQSRRGMMGEDHPETLESWTSLANLRESQDQLAEAARIGEMVLAAWRRLVGDDDPATLSAMNNLASHYQSLGRFEEAERLYQEALQTKTRVLGPENLGTLTTMHNLATLYRDRGQLDDAERLYLHVLEVRKRVLGATHPKTLTTIGNLARCLAEQHRFKEAETLERQTLEDRRRELGPEHEETLASMTNLSAILEAQGLYDEAESLARAAWESSLNRLGDEHVTSFYAGQQLASVYESTGRYLLAEPILSQTLETCRRVYGEQHPNTLAAANNLANLLISLEQLDRARELAERTLEIQLRVLGESHPDTHSSMQNLGAIHIRQQRFDQAEAILLRAYEILRRKLPEDDPGMMTATNNLGAVYAELGKHDEAIRLGEKTLEIGRRHLGTEHPTTLNFMSSLTHRYILGNNVEAALQMTEEYLAVNRTLHADNHRELAKVLERVSTYLLQKKQALPAERYLREAIALREEAEPRSSLLLEARSLLGDALRQQRQFDSAEQLLLQAHRAMQELEVEQPAELAPALRRSTERLVQLYEAWDRPADAEHWRKEIAP
jgi:serine/threonine protein kinase/Flp pilus assembly protein TadD